ncbi:unnamed protein product [Rotaria sordida]|uniref:Uncharacterized protein n=1 Tax=Rotaria sordida TaxID=392033 RepID=A0A815SRY3_9BILA|nr:unnamed protein product [Rotaria sordida]
MQSSWLCFFIVTFLTVTHGQFEGKDVRSIASGTSFGMCAGYCQQSINVTSDPLQVVASKRPNFDQESYPPVQRPFPIPASQWEQLVSSLNLKTFLALDNTIGCPDCADGGAEWIQVDWLDGTKHVTFDYGRTVDGIEDLIKKLRQMREEAVASSTSSMTSPLTKAEIERIVSSAFDDAFKLLGKIDVHM